MTTPFIESYRTHEFVVEIAGLSLTGITKVSGLTDGEVDSIDQPDGSKPYMHKIPGTIIKYGDITLERHMDGSPADAEFKAWWYDMFKLDGSGTGPTIRKSGSIIKKHFGVEVIRFVWEEGFVKKVTFADFDAKVDGLLTQTIVLAVERIYRIKG